MSPNSRILWPTLLIGTLLYYWTPLFDAQTSIQWDAVNYHYSVQKYLAESLADGLPLWTPHEYSGFPFLADPQVASWYPLHWPFLLAGITPKAIQWELALHALLALGGTYLLALRLTGNASASLLAGVFYAGNGFFAGHSSHLGLFETAALAPWLLWAVDRASASGTAGPLMLSGCIAGLVVLAGHFQTALYSFFALALFVLARRGNFLSTAKVLIGTGVVALLLSAIQILPGLELTAQSVRATANYHSATNGALPLAALATVISPDHYGVLSGAYRGPVDITQFYFYGGVLLLPLSLIGVARRTHWQIPFALVAPALLYALGPGTPLYSALTLLPGFAHVRAPVHIWFVVALGLSLAAAQGAWWLLQRFENPWLAAVLIAVSSADLWHFNMATNPLAYSRTSFESTLGAAQDRYESALLAVRSQPLHRVWSPLVSNDFGSLNSALESRLEVTYGYNPLQLRRYAEYIRVSNANPQLLNGLAVTHTIDWPRRAILPNPDALPRVSAPPRTTFVASADEARTLLETLDPSQLAIVEGRASALSCNSPQVELLEYRTELYRLKYNASGDCFLRFAVPYFPGWNASIDGQRVEVLPTDYALSGVIVPSGEHELSLRYGSTWFNLGAVISVLTACGLLAFALTSAASNRQGV